MPVNSYFKRCCWRRRRRRHRCVAALLSSIVSATAAAASACSLARTVAHACDRESTISPARLGSQLLWPYMVMFQSESLLTRRESWKCRLAAFALSRVVWCGVAATAAAAAATAAKTWAAIQHSDTMLWRFSPFLRGSLKKPAFLHSRKTK